MLRLALCLLPVFLLVPLLLTADSSFTLVSPQNGANVIVTPNQPLPILMLVNDTDTGLSALFARQYNSTVTATASNCPPEATPCGNYVSTPGAVPPFIVSIATQFHSAIAVINFKNAPLGFYTLAVAITIQGCYVNSPNCNLPDAYSANLQINVQVVNAIGPPANALPQFAVGGKRFLTDYLVINNSSSPANFTVNLYNDNGAAAPLPIAGLGTLSTLTDTIPAFGSSVYEAGDFNGPTQGGWASVQADPAITIQALIRSLGSDGAYYEATVPAYAGSTGFRLAFDATTFQPTGEPIYTGFGVANLDPQNPATVTCTARDFRGQEIPNAITVPALNPLGHWANYLFPALQGARGTLDCSSTTTVSAIGLRFIGTNAMSSLPIVLK